MQNITVRIWCYSAHVGSKLTQKQWGEQGFTTISQSRCRVGMQKGKDRAKPSWSFRHKSMCLSNHYRSYCSTEKEVYLASSTLA